jgi:hypothetical protein
MANVDLQNDKYVIQWLSGLAERTKQNYIKEIAQWNTFLGMTPTEQIQKRMHELSNRRLSRKAIF